MRGGIARGSSARRPAVTPAFALTAALVAVCAIGGGSPRVDPLSLLYVRPAVAVVLAVLMVLTARDGGATRWPLVLLGAWATTIAVQLVPLPPGVWGAVPGHARFAPIAGLVGEPAPWRPISLAPTLTWNALIALLPAWAGLLAASRLGRRDLDRLPVLLLAVAGASVVLGALQIGSGKGYLYAVTSPGLPVGLFANRNHQAAFLAAALPLLAVWAWPRGNGQWQRVRPWLALGAALLLIIFLMVTGSRAGLALGVVGAVAGASVAPPLAVPLPPALRPRRGRASPWVRLLPVGLAGLAALVAVVLGRSLATQRLAALTGAEQRTEALPTLLTMTRDFLPFGSGFGTFDPLFRAYEPDALLHRTVFNHAHDDLIEAALTGGLPALAVLAAFLAWFGWSVVKLWRMPDRGRANGRAAFAASVAVAILLGASLVDYPLRTPLLGVVLALLTGAVARAGAAEEPRLAAAHRRG